MPHRRIHIVAGKRQAVLKALGDMYNLETPKKPLNPGPELALTRVGHGGQFLEGEAEPWGEAPEGWPVVSSGVPLGEGQQGGPTGGCSLLAWADSQSSAVEEWTGPSSSLAAGQTPVGPLNGTPAPLDTDGSKGWVAIGQAVPGLTREAACLHTHESTCHGTAFPGSQCGHPCPT